MKKLLNITRKTSKILLWTFGILLILFLGIMAYWGYLIDYKPYKGVPFSTELWRQAGEHMKSQDRSLEDVLYGISPRCGMYDDLKTNYLKKGMHISEVEKLLGKAISTRYCAHKKIKCLSYGLGKCYANALTISSNNLTVCLNENNKIQEIGRQELDDKICDDKIIHCMEGETCKCFIQDKINGEKCNFTFDRW